MRVHPVHLILSTLFSIFENECGKAGVHSAETPHSCEELIKPKPCSCHDERDVQAYITVDECAGVHCLPLSKTDREESVSPSPFCS